MLLALFVAITLGLAFFFSPVNTETGYYARERGTEDALMQAKDALIGKAISERNNYLFGFLQTPDLGSTRNTIPEEGRSAGNFAGNAQNLSVIGRLPWRTLGIAPIKDVNGECLWYAVSGASQSAQPPAVFNWDSIGHFELFTSNGTAVGTVSASAGSYHDRPLAIVFSAGPPLAGQNRSTSADAVAECGGNYDVRNYLDTYTTDANIQNIVNYFSASANNATGNTSLLTSPKALIIGNVDTTVRIVNDRLLTITAKDIFDRAKQRSDFKSDVDALLNDLAVCLNSMPAIPVASVTNKGIDNIIAACPTVSPAKIAFTANWKENLLYAGAPSGNFTVNNDTASCKAVLIFSGERAAGQSRATNLEKNTAANYLEGTNAAMFPADGAYAGAAAFSAKDASKDIVRCITGLPAGATQVSFAQNLATFATTGAATTVTTNATASAVAISDNAGGTEGGCFWSPTPIPLAGKTLRAYYEYQFSFADTFTTTGATADRGNGFTFQLVRGDIPNVSGVFSPPDTCGIESNLGALGSSDSWGSFSYIVETDIRQNSGQNDPAGNHTGIMTNGSLRHAAGDTQTATLLTPCNGTKSSCLHYPANTFEEYPTTLVHNQRIEIHTGCNSTCTRCNPKITGTYAKISAWIDCTDCSDVVADLLDVELITLQANRDFSAPGDWAGTNWTVASNSLNHMAGATAASLPTSALTAPPATGTSYRIDVVINTATGGDISIAFGGNSTLPLTQPNGTATYTLQFDAVSAASLTLTPDANWVGSISRISIKPVKPPKINRCVISYPEMNQIFFGLTGGFLSTPDTVQGVTFKNLVLRTD